MNCSNSHSQCKAICCSCTTPIPEATYLKHKDKIVTEPFEEKFDRNHVFALTESTKCVFLNHDYSCNIYEDRPEICQSFGNETHPMLTCVFQSKEGRCRSRQEKRMVERKNEKWIKKFDIFARKELK